MGQRRSNGEGTIQTRKRLGKVVGYRGIIEIAKQTIYGPQVAKRSDALPALYAKLKRLERQDQQRELETITGPKLSTYARRLLTGQLRTEWAPNTLELGYTVLGRVNGTPLADLGIFEIGPQELQAWRDQLGISIGSANRYQRIIERWLALAGRNVKSPKPKAPDPVIRILSRSEQEELIQRAHQPRTRLALMLLIDLGIRAGEVCGLRHEDRHDDGVFIVRQGSRDRLKTTASNAWIPLSDRLLELVGPPRSGYVLATENGTAMAVNNLRRMVQSVAEGTAYADICPQDLRHTAAVNMLRAGVDALTVSTITRHSVDTLLKVYHRVEQEGKREAMRRVQDWKSSA